MQQKEMSSLLKSEPFTPSNFCINFTAAG